MRRALATARAAADRAGLVWVADALEDLERQRDAYDRKSAAFSSRAASLLVAEIGARVRAARSSSAIPPRVVLGSDEARETITDQVRLTPLGVRLRADGDRRDAALYFADRDSKLVLVLRKTWPGVAGSPPKNGHDLAEQYASSKLSLASLARGDIVARGARRRANGELDLSAARGLKTSVLPGDVAWEDLPSPLLIDDLAAHEQAARSAPPKMLCPRRIGQHAHVLRVGRVLDVSYHRGEQALHASLEDPHGGRAFLRVAHRTVSPGAVDATFRALERAPRFVAGELERTAAGWEIAPLALLGDRLSVPDIEKARAGDLPTGEPLLVQPLVALLDALGELVDRGVHKGATVITDAQLAALAARFDTAGLPRVGQKILAAQRPAGLLDLAIVRAILESTPVL